MIAKGGIVGNGIPFKTLDGALNIHRAAVHQRTINDFFHRHGAATTLTVAANPGDVSITVADTTGFVVGAYVHLGPSPATTEPIHPQITIVAPATGPGIVTLDRPLDFGYTNGAEVLLAIVNMRSVAGGTLAAPIVYRYFPQEGRIEHIKQIILSMDHSSPGADDLFGGIAKLINGVVLRAHISGETGTLTNWKNNSDIKLDFGPERVIYAAKSGGGTHGTAARGSFDDLDIGVRLDAAAGDFLEILIQDTAITGLTDFRVKTQGHVEGDN